MTRKEIYAEMEDMLGFVPTFLKAVPDSSLEPQWQTMKLTQFGESPVPNKYRQLIGLGVAAVTKCQYCACFHMEVAKLYGATEDEMKDAVRFAGVSANWSTWLNGLQFDYDQFRKEVKKIVEHVRSATPAR